MGAYQGNKYRYVSILWEAIIENLEKDNVKIDDNTYIVDLFCGGCNFIGNIPLKNRIANDISKPVVSYYKKITTNVEWLLEYDLQNITEEQYNYIRTHQTQFSPELVHYASVPLSFNAQYFSKYAPSDKKTVQEYNRTAYNSAVKDSQKLQGVKFYNLDYRDVPIPPHSIVYCDIPYKNTKSYTNTKNNTDTIVKVPFDYDAFYDYAKKLVAEGHYVFFSEINPDHPEGIKQILEFERFNAQSHTGKNNKGRKRTKKENTNE